MPTSHCHSLIVTDHSITTWLRLCWAPLSEWGSQSRYSQSLLCTGKNETYTKHQTPCHHTTMLRRLKHSTLKDCIAFLPFERVLKKEKKVGNFHYFLYILNYKKLCLSVQIYWYRHLNTPRQCSDTEIDI